MSCKGSWQKCALDISVTKENISDQEDLYEFLIKPDLVKELGDEQLVEDLIQRHKDAEKKLPATSKGRFIKPNLGMNNHE